MKPLLSIIKGSSFTKIVLKQYQGVWADLYFFALIMLEQGCLIEVGIT
jgi:hypothetical protein